MALLPTTKPNRKSAAKFARTTGALHSRRNRSSQALAKQLLENQFNYLRSNFRSLARKGGLCAEEQDDFVGWAFLKLVENNYRILRRGRSLEAVRPFLRVVASNLLRDYRNRIWGKWRPSARAVQRGSSFVDLEKFVTRDGFSHLEAVSLAQQRSPSATKSQEFESSLAALRQRGRPTHVQLRETEVPLCRTCSTPGKVATGSRDAERFQAERLCRLEKALEQLPSSERQILKWRFEDGLKICRIADRLGKPAKAFYPHLASILLKLRRHLAADLAQENHPIFPPIVGPPRKTRSCWSPKKEIANSFPRSPRRFSLQIDADAPKTLRARRFEL